MSIRNSSIPTKKYKMVLSAVHMVYRLINSTYNVKELALRLTRLLCQFISAESSMIYLIDPKTKKVVANYILQGDNLPIMTYGEDEAGEAYFTTPFGQIFTFAKGE